MVPARRRASMSFTVQNPAMVARSCVVEEASACAGYSSGDLNPAVHPLEIEQPVAQDAEAGQRFPHLRLNGAEIFADDDGVVAHAFERQNAHQVLREIADVSAVRRVVALAESSRAGTAASRDRCAARRRAATICGSTPLNTAGNRLRDAARNRAAGTTSPGRSAKNRPAAIRPGSRRHKNWRCAQRSQPQRSVASARS